MNGFKAEKLTLFLLEFHQTFIYPRLQEFETWIVFMAFGLSLCLGKPLGLREKPGLSKGQAICLTLDVALIAITTATTVLIAFSLQGVPMGPLNALSSLGRAGFLGFGGGVGLLFLWDFVALISQIPQTLKSLVNERREDIFEL